MERFRRGFTSYEGHFHTLMFRLRVGDELLQSFGILPFELDARSVKGSYFADELQRSAQYIAQRLHLVLDLLRKDGRRRHDDDCRDPALTVDVHTLMLLR